MKTTRTIELELVITPYYKSVCFKFSYPDNRPLLVGGMAEIKFAAVNDDESIFDQQEEINLLQAKNEWLEEFNGIIEIARDDIESAFKSTKSLLSDISSFNRSSKKNGSNNNDTLMTRSVLELKQSVLKFSLDLALQLGEYQQVFDTALKTIEGDPNDVWYWDLLSKSMTHLNLPLSIHRIIYERLVNLRPGMVSGKSLLSFLESIGDYQSINESTDKVKSLIFQLGNEISLPKFAITKATLYVPPPIPVRTVILNERSYFALINKLLSLYEDDEVKLCQLINIVLSNESTNCSIGNNYNTLAMSFSRRPSIDDLGALRSSKRRQKEGGSQKKTRQQLYEETDISEFFKSKFETEPEDREKSNTNIELFGWISADFFDGTYSLANWIKKTISYICENARFIYDRRVCESLAKLFDTELYTEINYKTCIARCFSLINDGSETEKIQSILSKFEHKLDSCEDLESFILYYHYIKSKISITDEEALYHLRCCEDIPLCNVLGHQLSSDVIKKAISNLAFKKKFIEMNENMNTVWFSSNLFNGNDLSDPGICLSSVPLDLHCTVITATVKMLNENKIFGKSHRWINHAFSNSFFESELCFEYAIAMRNLPSAFVNKNCLSFACGLCVKLVNQGLEGEEKEMLIPLLASIVAWSKGGLASYLWLFLSIDAIDKFKDHLFIKLLLEIKDDLPCFVRWNLLRVLNGLPQYFDTEDEADSIEPLQYLDLKKNKCFEKLKYPDDLLKLYLLLYKTANVKDEIKYAEFLDILSKGFSKEISSINRGILTRLFDRELLDCWTPFNLHLFTPNEKQSLLSQAIYRRVKISYYERKKPSTDQIRSWRDDLIFALSGYNRCWMMLSDLSMQLIKAELKEYYDGLELTDDVKIALTSNVMTMNEKNLAELFLLMANGPISHLVEQKKKLSKAFTAVCRLRADSEVIVFLAMAEACSDHPQYELKIFESLIRTSRNISFEIKYTVALRLLELTSHGHVSQLIESLFHEFPETHDISACLEYLGSLDKKKIQHRHLFMIAKINPSIGNWATIFPFLTSPKCQTFSNIWHCDQDLPAMHLVYRSQYVKELLRYLATFDTDLYLLTCKKIASHTSELFNCQEVIELALALLTELNTDRMSIFNVLKKVCSNEDFLKSIKSQS